MSSPAPPAHPILLVDDGSEEFAELHRSLANLGHTLLVARTGAEAATLARQARPDVILTDARLPDMDGFELCRQLRTDQLTSGCAVMFLSQLTETRDKLEGLWLGAADFITRPLLLEEVLARIETQLDIQQLKRELAQRNRQLEAARQHLLESVGEGIYGVDAEGIITFANPAACRLSGYSEEQLIGQSFFDTQLRGYPDGGPPQPEPTPLHQVLASGGTARSDDHYLRRASGDAYPVSMTCAAMPSGDGAVIAFQDISQRKHQEHELHRALAEVQTLKERLQAENTYLQAAVRDEGGFGDIVGESPELLRVLNQVRQVAPTDTAVLVLGESGTGKEAVARGIHQLSTRRNRPLIKVNCGAIAGGLLESELFGHEKGAFTGALRQRRGLFELADGGTIFLDEISELPADAQVKLLRVLQEGEFTRVGGEEPLLVDVRVIAASNRDLAGMVAENAFRADLFYRLNVFPLTLPPLRERRADIPLLARKFVLDQGRRLARVFTGTDEASMRLLCDYHWPGNIRELQNVIERAAILATTDVLTIDPSQLQSAGSPEQVQPGQSTIAAEGRYPTLAEQEAAHIRRVLAATRWAIAGKGGAAEILGLPPSTLRSRMKKLGISRPV